MTTNHVAINQNSNKGGQLQQAVNGLASTQFQLQRLLGIMNQCNDGTDYSDVEAQFGITPISGATGTNTAGYKVWYQLNTVVNALTNSDVSAAIQQFLNQLG